MSKSNIITVSVVVVLSLAMTWGLAFWLGPSNSSTQAQLSNNDAQEKLQAPLTAENLKAYNVNMTNENNPVAEFNTNQGKFELELFEDTMPITAGNFITLAKDGFYNGVKFHRVIDGFMIQSGDPITKTEEFLRYGTGGPGYAIPDEHIAGEYLTNVRGTISMANSGPESGGSQFFINVADNTNLDFDKPPFSSKHPVFGRVLSGMEVVDKIAKVEVNGNDMPLEAVIVESVVIKD
ncbi:MAG: peptidylprolyl isomerase [Candidatus Paceibacterota bacterium]